MSEPNGSPSLDELRAALPRPTETVFEIDMSFFLPLAAKSQPEGKMLFTFRRLGVNQIFGVEECAIIIKRQKSEWSDKLCLEVACMVLCHKTPAPKENNRLTTTLFYCDLFSDDEKDPQLLTLIQEFSAKAGANFLNNMQKVVEDRKKNSKNTRRNSQRSRTASNISTDTPMK